MSKHILFFEPRTEGHHLSWLCMLVEDFLEGGYDLTLAIDLRNTKACDVINEHSPKLLSRVKVLNAYDDRGKIRGGSKIRALADCFEESGADEVFCNSLDEFASSICRWACLGIYPPKTLIGKISGIYHRPKPFDDAFRGWKEKIKKYGLRKLQKKGLFKDIFILDELLIKRLQGIKNVHLIVDPWSESYDLDKEIARERLGIDAGKIVILNYGAASRRKGLKLLLDAFEGLNDQGDLFLLVAGKVAGEEGCFERLENLKKLHKAEVLNYYVSAEEENLCFSACDYVAMPYLSHYGSSGILSRAAASGKAVIASDYHLLGYLVKTYQLGLIFENENVNSLKEILEKIIQIKDGESFKENLQNYAKRCSRESFRASLYKVFPKLK